ncbi:MAG: PAS/PAC sensor hybrid histidine kinase [Nitrospirae bacterium]|nr:MAG: PAS/PAC sensor hybrid histidine kinase [Nitrospirota bacterium]
MPKMPDAKPDFMVLSVLAGISTIKLIPRSAEQVVYYKRHELGSNCRSRERLVSKIFLHMLRVGLVCIVLAAFFAERAVSANSGVRQEVLILHSYSPDYAWTRSEQSGIDSVFQPLNHLFKVRIEYLDSNHNPELLQGNLLRQLYKQKFATTPFQVIIATDNAALKFLRSHRQAIFPGVPVVFCGVNGYEPGMILGLSNITGIAEDNDFIGLFNLIVRLHPYTKRIVIYGVPDDPSHSANIALIRKLRPEFRQDVAVEVREFPNIERAILDAKTLPADSIVLMVGGMRNVAGVGINLQRANELMSPEIKVPIYTAWDFGVNHGAVGGFVTSGFEQGRLAAEIAWRILQGERADNIPVIRHSANYYLFDYRQLSRFGMRMDMLPADARILNEPEKGYRMPSQVLWAVFLSFAILSTTIVVLALNIRSRRRAEKALAASEEKYSKAFRNSADVVGIARLSDGSIMEVSDVFYETFGYVPEEIIGKIGGVRGHEGTDGFALWESAEERSSVFAQLASEKSVKNLELAWYAKSSDCFVGLFSAEIILIGGQSCIIFVWHDITDRKKAEEKRQELEDRLRQTQKIESIGMLVGGIAHDFNNVLTPIFGYAEMLLAKVDKADGRYNKILQIKLAAERASALTRQLLAFSRRQVLELRVLDLALIIKQCEQMLRRTIREDINIDMRISPDVGLIKADRGQIEQVLMNLAVNAQDAMPNGGTMLIGAKNVMLDDSYVMAHPDASAGPHVVLSVSDTGTGIDPKIREHLFEPFYTTKEEGKGTGLGLSTVYGIVKQHGGSISVYSEPGRGTVFHVYMPRVPSDIAADSSPFAETQPAQLPRGDELILLVEDDDMVRTLAVEMLDMLGYRVIAADSAESCFALFEQSKNEIALLLTDVIMPNMNGKQIYEHLAAKHPALKVIFMSGYAGDVISHHGVLDDNVHFMQKPLSLQTLAENIRHVLDS